MNKIDVIGVIDENYPAMSKGHKAIANYIKEYYDTAVFMTAAKIGEEIGVSESTVVRFASNLGYNGFPNSAVKVCQPFYLVCFLYVIDDLSVNLLYCKLDCHFIISYQKGTATYLDAVPFS